MAMENKRIIQLNTERTTPAADDYVMVDSATAGTAKYLLPKITDAIDQEISDRTSADTALQTAITNETTARANADTTLQGNITAEATARAEADTAINGEITQLKEDLTDEITARENADDAINAVLATKADTDGAIASAEQLLSDKYTIDQVPYTFRASGGDGADREYDEIVGGTINWNQLVDTNTTSVTVPSNHKYLAYIGGSYTIGISTSTAMSVTGGTDMVHDLTAMFGTTVADHIYSLEQAGAGVAWVRRYLPESYYAYCAPKLEHVTGVSAHVMTGFNQWDEEWRNGYYNASGVFVENSGYVASKNAIPVLSGALYHFRASRNFGRVCWYDCDMVFVSSGTPSSSEFSLYAPSNARYASFDMQGTYGTTYNHDICINLSDESRNGEYEPYVKHSYPLDDSLTLRGIPKLDENNQLYYDGDIYSADGTVTRKYGIVDLGTLNWEYDGDEMFRSNIYTAKYKGLGICSKYQVIQVGSWSQVGDKQMSVTNSQNQPILRIHDSSMGTDAAAFKTAMSGVYLVYELATPTTEEAEPYQELQLCDPNGTEEYVTTSLVPVGHYTKYPANLRSAIERVMEQVPEAPSANGTYTLKATRTSSGVTYAWTAE